MRKKNVRLPRKNFLLVVVVVVVKKETDLKVREKKNKSRKERENTAVVERERKVKLSFRCVCRNAFRQEAFRERRSIRASEFRREGDSVVYIYIVLENDFCTARDAINLLLHRDRCVIFQLHHELFPTITRSFEKLIEDTWCDGLFFFRFRMIDAADKTFNCV